MRFATDFDEPLKKKLTRLFKKDKNRYEILMKKITQISNCDGTELDHFKNLRHDLSDEKRVHVDKSFVLTLRVDHQRKLILFLNFDHHDAAYEKWFFSRSLFFAFFSRLV